MVIGTADYDEDALIEKRPCTDVNRLGARKKIPTNCSLALKKVPISLNNITSLNNHFSKFGMIVNIKCGYKGDPKAAIITFSGHAEANAAYRSTEAVLNNRFIKVFWHLKNSTNGKQDNVLRPLVNERIRQIVAPNSDKIKNEKKAQIFIKKSQGIFAIKVKLNENQEKLQKLEKQLVIQKTLISKMERTPAGFQREYLLRVIKKFQKSIEPIRKVTVAQPTTSAMTPSPQRTKNETQKDSLDAELDLITEQLKRTHLRSSGTGERTYIPIRTTYNHLLPNTNAINSETNWTTTKCQKHAVEHPPARLSVSDFETNEQESFASQFSVSRKRTSSERAILVSESNEDHLLDEETTNEREKKRMK